MNTLFIDYWFILSTTKNVWYFSLVKFRVFQSDARMTLEVFALFVVPLFKYRYILEHKHAF